MSVDSSQSPTLSAIGTSPLRIGAGITLLYIHAWNQAIFAWQYIRHQQTTDFIETIRSIGLPMPNITAVVIAIVTTLTAIGWIFGFYSRLLSLLFLPITLGALLVANRADQGFAAESALLYFFIALTILINGSGWLSLDAIFIGRPRKKRRR